MIERIEQVGGANWRKILARTPHFSEYTMYGMFVKSLGVEAAGHYVDPASPVHCLWEDEPETPEEEAAFIAALGPHQFACLVQSTMKMDLAARRSPFCPCDGRSGATGPAGSARPGRGFLKPWLSSVFIDQGRNLPGAYACPAGRARRVMLWSWRYF